MAPAIGGYCPVAHVAVGKAIKGDLKFASTFEGHKYLFVNADAKQMFDAAVEHAIVKAEANWPAVKTMKLLGMKPRPRGTGACCARARFTRRRPACGGSC